MFCELRIPRLPSQPLASVKFVRHKMVWASSIPQSEGGGVIELCLDWQAAGENVKWPGERGSDQMQEKLVWPAPALAAAGALLVREHAGRAKRGVRLGSALSGSKKTREKTRQ